MKLIIIESGDQLGKSTLIKGLCKYFDYKNITIRHCDKPPKGMNAEDTLNFQFAAFNEESELIQCIRNKTYSYHDDIIIYDRFHLGEYVYGQMFRNANPIYVANLLKLYELDKLNVDTNDEIYLITLTADPDFFLSKEDGNSFSTNIKEKTRELKLFKDIHNISTIPHKLLLKVDEDSKFRDKDEILNEVINFIYEKNN